ncbi:hypothetical protein NE236_06810 [Actinoallomurus purpureus]|uniref:hypothetical protein n=1 Tax=Actinoallomurus purpureus TaxID=478114 RepID=UPI0020935D9F|nr:hypothetical protein [Actinoallomurus purpureus]MCO6004686.1 hypothetical protein [Actinoallomurus purpureus]
MRGDEARPAGTVREPPHTAAGAVVPALAPPENGLIAALRRIEEGRRTGVLRAGDDGVLHLTDGAVTFAESRWTPAPDAGPPAPSDRWPAPGRTDGAPRPVPDDPAGWHRETRVLLAIFDAMYFLLDSDAAPSFTERPPHRPVPECRISPTALLRECARRRDEPDAGWPSTLVDRAPVVPVRTVRRRRIVLTAPQIEVILNADGRRTPADLARDLGRTAFGCLTAVRALTAAELVRPARNEPEALPVRRRRPPPQGPDGDEGAASGPWAPVELDVLVRLRAGLEELT